MKKTFKAFALMLLTALAFSSCVDVPAPYNVPDKSSNTGGGGGTGTNEGTPVTCAEAVELAKALADGATSSETYTITGYITEVVGDVSRNQQTFWMADTKGGGRVFEAYWANLPEGVTAFKAGTKVKITGKLMKFVNNSGNVIPEMKNATVTILEDEGGGGGGTVEGTSVTCAEAAELANALADGATSSETYTITGYITEVVGDVSRNQQTFWMADTKGGGRVFEAYWANLPEGVTAFTVGTKVKITGQLMKFVNNSGNVIPEMKNATVVILADDGGDTPVDGTPVTCAQAAELANALADGGTSSETYAVTGYITEVIGTVSRNQQTFWMADTKGGGRVFEAYWANLPEGVSEFAVGMKVTITGQLMKFVNNTGVVTPEIKNADVVILENGDGGGGGGDDQGDVQHITIAEFLQKADVNTTYELTGTVRNIVNTTYGNFDLVEGDATIYIYGLLDLNGEAKKFESLGIEDGDIVTLTGKYVLYNDKPEIKNAQFVSVVKGDGGGGGGDDPTPGPGGDPVTDLVNGDFESWVSDTEPEGWNPVSSAGNATLSKSTDARNGNFACAIVAPGSQNKRLATQEMTLEAGSYTFSFYAKATTGSPSQTRAGYVPIKADGSVDTYKYGDFVDLNNSSWTLVTYSFELTATTKLCLLVMNPKNSSYSTSQDVLIDDATLVKNQ